MKLIRLLYVSGATRSLSQDDLDDILAASRRNNGQLGVTGMLLWADGAFIQVLEGAEASVRRLVDRIRRDDRHRNVMVILEEPMESRVFGNWQMGFKALDPAQQGERSLFQTSREALESRISLADGGIMLDTVLAFSPDFVRRA